MNLSFYLAIDHIPLGVAVTLEFVGPLGVAVLGSRRLLDGLWAALAAVGIVLLAPLNVLGNSDLDPVGVTFALLAGCLWACYILLTARVGSMFPGGAGLAISLAVGTVVLLPVGMADAGYALLDPWFLLAGLGVALLSSVVPYSLEMQALRRLPTRVFGLCRPKGGPRPPRRRRRRPGHRRGGRGIPLRQSRRPRIDLVHRTVGQTIHLSHEPGVAHEERETADAGAVTMSVPKRWITRPGSLRSGCRHSRSPRSGWGNLC
jgi:hypothetical protein